MTNSLASCEYALPVCSFYALSWPPLTLTIWISWPLTWAWWKSDEPIYAYVMYFCLVVLLLWPHYWTLTDSSWCYEKGSLFHFSFLSTDILTPEYCVIFVPFYSFTYLHRMIPSFRPFWKSAPMDWPVTSSIHPLSSSSFDKSYFCTIC